MESVRLLGVRSDAGTRVHGARGPAGRGRGRASYGLWETRFGADRSIIGRTVALDRRPDTVVGVMPPAFSFPLRGRGFNATPAAAWVPMAFADSQLRVRGNEFSHGVVGRLKTGTSIEEARAELEVLARRVNERYPQPRNLNSSIAFAARPLREETSGPLQRPLLLLLGAVGLVLLVTCANVANLGPAEQPRVAGSLPSARRSARAVDDCFSSCSPKARSCRSPAAPSESSSLRGSWPRCQRP